MNWSMLSGSGDSSRFIIILIMLDTHFFPLGFEPPPLSAVGKESAVNDT